MGTGTRLATERSVDGLHFLTQSRVRIRILELLYEAGSLEQPEIANRVEASRVTIRRNLDALTERHLVRGEDRTYAVTALGKTIIEDARPALQSAALVNRLRPFVRWFPEDELAFDIRELADATVVVANATDPYAPVNRHIEALKDADRARCLLPAVGLPAMSVVRDRILNDDCEHETVFSTDIEPTVRVQPEYRELIEEFCAAENCNLFVADRTIPFYLGLFEETVQIGVENDDGVPKALVETQAPAVRDWAAYTFESYQTQAERLAL